MDSKKRKKQKERYFGGNTVEADHCENQQRHTGHFYSLWKMGSFGSSWRNTAIFRACKVRYALLVSLFFIFFSETTPGRKSNKKIAN